MDLCLYMKKHKKGIMNIALYLDENLLIGDPEAAEEIIELLQRNGLILKAEDNLHYYLSCEINF